MKKLNLRIFKESIVWLGLDLYIVMIYYRDPNVINNNGLHRIDNEEDDNNIEKCIPTNSERVIEIYIDILSENTKV